MFIYFVLAIGLFFVILLLFVFYFFNGYLYGKINRGLSEKLGLNITFSRISFFNIFKGRLLFTSLLIKSSIKNNDSSEFNGIILKNIEVIPEWKNFTRKNKKINIIKIETVSFQGVNGINENSSLYMLILAIGNGLKNRKVNSKYSLDVNKVIINSISVSIKLPINKTYSTSINNFIINNLYFENFSTDILVFKIIKESFKAGIKSIDNEGNLGGRFIKISNRALGDSINTAGKFIDSLFG